MMAASALAASTVVRSLFGAGFPVSASLQFAFLTVELNNVRN